MSTEITLGVKKSTDQASDDISAAELLSGNWAGANVSLGFSIDKLALLVTVDKQVVELSMRELVIKVISVLENEKAASRVVMVTPAQPAEEIAK